MATPAPAPNPTDPALQPFIEELQDVQRMLAALFAGCVLFMLLMVGMYVITQLMGMWRRSLERRRGSDLPPAADAWAISGQRLRPEPDSDV